MRRALRIATVMTDLPVELVPLRRERKSLLRVGGACFLALSFGAFAAFPCFGQQSPEPNTQVASSSTPTDGTPTPATPAASPAPAAPAAPAPLPMPSMSGPLATASPHEGPGKLEVTGILSGMGWTEGKHMTGDSPTHW